MNKINNFTFDSQNAVGKKTSFVDGVKENFQIVRLAEGDVRCKSDHFSALKRMVLANEEMYPGIHEWFSEKVIPGIRFEERVAFIGYSDEKPMASAIVRKGHDAKFCHLKISENLQDAHLGETFFSLMAFEVRDLAKLVHFTLPEALWKQRTGFFQSFGFSAAQLAETQYRLFDRELACSAGFGTLWHSVMRKIPKLSGVYSSGGFSLDNQLLLSVKPHFADRILLRKKRVELRRKFSTRWLGSRINLYASSPVMSIVGEARISGVTRDTPEMIWNRFQQDIGCSRAEFDAYVSGADEVYAIELDDIHRYRTRIGLAEVSSALSERLNPPQSYLTLEKGKPWAKAVSIAEYFQNCVRNTFSLVSDLSLKKEVKFTAKTDKQSSHPISPFGSILTKL